MKIIRLLFFLLILVGLLLSCHRKEELSAPVNSGRICFGTPRIVTELAVKSVSELPEGFEFGVLGFCIPSVSAENPELDYSGAMDSWSEKFGRSTADVFYYQRMMLWNGACVYDRRESGPSGSTSVPDHHPKWWYRTGFDTENQAAPQVQDVSGYRYAFLAYSPYTAFELISPRSADDPAPAEMNLILPYPDTSPDLHLDASATPDALLSWISGHRQIDGSIRPVFYHLLSGLGFCVSNSSSEVLQIDEILLSGRFYKRMNIRLTENLPMLSYPEGENGDFYQGTYVIYDGADDRFDPLILQPAGSPGEPTVSSYPMGPKEKRAPLLLIPGAEKGFAYAGENLQLSVKYRKSGSSASIIQPFDIHARPENGVIYKVEICFLASGYEIRTTAAEQWQDGEETQDGNDVLFE